MSLPALSVIAYGIALLILAGNLVYLHRNRNLATDICLRPSVSILVPARNEAQNLSILLPSILEQDYPDFEIVVVDDDSDDATPEVLGSFSDRRLLTVRSPGPPPGWIGKVHALYRATRLARGEIYLFLDADAHLTSRSAIRHLVSAFVAHRSPSVLTGLPHWTGGGQILVSLLPLAILVGLPWPLSHLLPFRSMTALNGQLWMIRRDDYHRFEPHAIHRDRVLEDVAIGRFFKTQGVAVWLHDVRTLVSVRMYADFRDAWAGFRKNAALLFGGGAAAVFLFLSLWIVLVFIPLLLEPVLLVPFFGLKLATDRFAGIPVWVTALAPISVAMGMVLMVDSLIAHGRGRAMWKGRPV